MKVSILLHHIKELTVGFSVVHFLGLVQQKCRLWLCHVELQRKLLTVHGPKDSEDLSKDEMIGDFVSEGGDRCTNCVIMLVIQAKCLISTYINF